ncbi:FAD/NAD(P)-binding protein [Kibdelosporangium persicum]|uniref:NAD(P)/FAD-binding protein YdhS n=1 Tax=Kibdelosporangium persicum TaxID=2698649 RepID=A0ABX2FGT3_9PSEU|nr:FAD/NAD(P)-binding protein [Kibdelosporangium persicum]NRN70585.1 putative NAD(P)/FAD-binding protein YdhS [Kibdelosporangium persicum]
MTSIFVFDTTVDNPENGGWNRPPARVNLSGMRIGIIGAGAAGVSVLDALSLAEPTPSGITVFESSPWMWRGRAYQPDLEAVRVNAPPALMSIRHGDREHYWRWLADREGYLDTSLGVPIVPRAVYGEYLEATALTAIRRLRERGTEVKVVNDRVTDYSALQTTMDHVLVCVGGGTPSDHYGLSGREGFVLEPYPLARTLDGVPTDSHVVVIGSGLTAVDIAVALAATGHSGPITLLSRNGVLPSVQQTPVKLEFQHLIAENLPGTFDGLASLLRAELATHGQDLAPLAGEITRTEDPVERLRRQLSEVDSDYLGRRMLAVGIHTLGPAAWRRLPDADRDMLRTGHFRAITSLASPMVPVNAEIVLRLLDSGQLRLLAGIPGIEATSRGFHISGSGELTADVVLNAVNPDSGATGPVHVLGSDPADTTFVVPSVPTVAASASAAVAKICGQVRHTG